MSRLLESETLTILVLFAITVLAGYVLAGDSKEVLSSVVAGLLGYLTKAVQVGVAEGGTGNPDGPAASSIKPPQDKEL